MGTDPLAGRQKNGGIPTVILWINVTHLEVFVRHTLLTNAGCISNAQEKEMKATAKTIETYMMKEIK